jgi:hypothetical protein
MCGFDVATVFLVSMPRNIQPASGTGVAALVLAALAAVSCNDARLPVQPSNSAAPSSSNPASPITSFAVVGSVRDTHLNGLSDVAVEIIDGPMSGTVVRTDEHGGFRFPDAFAEEATLRATKAGYLTATAMALRPATRTVGGPQTLLTIELPSPEPSIDISGTYTFTVGNDPGCDLIPEPLRVRTYDVILASHTNPYSFRMNFTDPNVFDAWNPAIEIRLKGSQMQMVIGDWNAGIIEDLPAGWMTFFGYAQATMTDSGVSGSFLEGGSGYTYCPGARTDKGTNVTTWDCAAPQRCSKGFRYSLTRR